MKETRLDVELVRRGLARSRQHAGVLIREKHVEVDGMLARKAAQPCPSSADVRLVGDVIQYASRGAFKLIGALDALPQIAVAGRVCLDAGASTGGFTDVLIEREAAFVHAVDVGTAQMLPRLVNHDRVHSVEKTNVRYLQPGDLVPEPSLVVSDLSFISLTLIVPALIAVATPDADMLLMVKPQFEVGKGRLGAHGVVRSAEARADAVCAVAQTAVEHAWYPHGLVRSSLPGPAGNLEYFLWLRAESDGALADFEQTAEDVTAAIPEGE